MVRSINIGRYLADLSPACLVGLRALPREDALVLGVNPGAAHELLAAVPSAPVVWGAVYDGTDMRTMTATLEDGLEVCVTLTRGERDALAPAHRPADERDGGVA